MIRIAIAGAAGRMGRAVIESCAATGDISIGAAIEHAGSPALGRDAGEAAGIGPIGVRIAAEPAADAFDVLVDFTAPDAAVRNAAFCRESGRRIVIGTTGLDPVQKQSLADAARDIAVVFSPNMSIGVNLCFRLAELAAQIIGADSDIEIVEAHHREKRDAPSGTAMRLGEIVAGALGRDLGRCAVYGRHGDTGPRDRHTIGFETIRAGDIVGDHTVLFASAGERVEITHRAASRATFAAGALRAARWVMQRDRGLFDMQDVLGLR
jgi:4-hydroxy-tetrahydrodipicolinate reductase